MSEADRISRAYHERDANVGSRYDLRNAGNRLVLAERRQLARRLLDAAGWIPLGERRVLDVGCGVGSELVWLLELGASASHLVGIDLVPDRIAAARRAYPELEFHVANAERLEFADGSFELLMAFTIFSSILDPSMSSNVAREIVRVLKPGGGLLWYDFRYDNPSNRNVRGVSETNVRKLFPTLHGKLYRVSVLPPLVRRLGPLTPVAYPVLGLAPPLRSHLLGLLRKHAD